MKSIVKQNFLIFAAFLILTLFINFANAAVPVVTLQPVSQTVDSGTTAFLTVAGDVVTSYAWYKKSDMDDMIVPPVPGSDVYQSAGDTLTIADVNLVKEGAYYCVLTNGSGSTISDVVTVMTKRLVARWELEDYDFEDSVSGYDGVSYYQSYGYPQFTNGAEGCGTVGNAASFTLLDAGESVVVTPFKRKINLESFSVCAWAKVTGGSGTYRAVLSTRVESPQAGYFFYAQSDNTWSFWSGYGNYWNKIGGNVPVVENEWVFLVGTYDAQTNVQSLYVNGNVSRSVTVTPVLPNSLSDFLIGSVTSYSGTFVGDIDDVRYYSYPLTQEEIAQLYSEKLCIPTILDQPVSQVVDVNSIVDLQVYATDVCDLTYTWYKSDDWDNNTPGDDSIIGTDSNTLTIASFQLANEGFYYCSVTNGINAVKTNAFYVLAKRTIAHWEFEDDLTDSVGSLDLARSVSGTSVYGQGIIGSKALEISSIDDRVEVESVFLNLPTFSVSAWAKLTGGTYYRAVVSTRPDYNPTSGFFIAASDTNKWTLWTGDGTNDWNNRTTSDDTVVYDQWAYLVGTYSKATNIQQLYVNGVLVDQINANTIFLGNSLRFLVGSATVSTLSFEGLIDDVKYYDYVLPAEEIAQTYANTIGQDVCVSFPEHDYNEDCVVDFADFAEWATSWLESNIVSPSN